MKNNNKNSYDPLTIELKWQSKWQKDEIYHPNLDTAKQPFYNLMMFPYPSAEGLHIGGVRTFVGVDIYSRYKRMRGHDVFMPFGLDGFGIHAENYALKIGQNPMTHAKVTEENFYRQMKEAAISVDWERSVETYKPDYYKWTQWLFIELFKAGLAYRKKSPVNFCPSCKTVLADEQVIDGKCERCSSIVEKKNLEQWFFRITKYADRLLVNIDGLDWSEKVKIAQKQWIGKKDGVQIKHKVVDQEIEFETFSAFPAWSWADSYIVIAPEHPLIKNLVDGTEHEKSVNQFIQESKSISNQDRIEDKFEKKGVFTGRFAKDPFGGVDMPIWLANFALMDFGTGIIRCSGHDPRDVEFAKKYDIKIKEVVERINPDEPVNAHANKGILKDSGPFTGREVGEVIEETRDWIEKEGIGKKVTTFHLRDWLISRQRYWGPPIPMIFCDYCFKNGKGEREEMKGWYAASEKDLPVELPFIEDFKPLGTGKSPLATHPEFYEVKCPHCDSDARRETDVSDTFLDSAWYFFRYTSTEFSDVPFDAKRVKKWLPVNMYIGGAEHSVLHLLYARFVTMFLKDRGLINFEEPFTRFYAHGLIIKEGAKMSKSKGNVVGPDIYIKKFGADTLRMYLHFLAPFNQDGDFRDSGVEGMHRFLKKVWRLFSEAKISNFKFQISNERLKMMHQTIKGVTEDMENLRYNTAIAKLMEYYNFLIKQDSVSSEETEAYLKLLAPFAPHMTEELYEGLNLKSIHTQPWPEFDEKYLKTDTVNIPVQVNGKFRITLIVEQGSDEDKVVDEALKNEMILKHIGGRKFKTIFIKNKILNFVTS